MDNSSLKNPHIEETREEKKLIAVSQWDRYYDYPTVGALRNLIFKSDKNGFDKCLKKVGGRLYIEVSAFFEWVDERSKKELNGGF